MSDILQELRDEADLCRNETADDIANLLDEAANEIQRLRAVVKHEDDCLEAVKAENAQIRLRLREHQCPRPCSQRPDDFTIGQCVDAGECGCGSQVAAYPDRLGRANSGMGLGLTSPSVPQSVLERLDWLEAQWTDAGNTIEIQSAEITRLRAENAKLREALREAVIVGPQGKPGTRWTITCWQCDHAWAEGDPEHHAPDCLAAPKEKTE